LRCRRGWRGTSSRCGILTAASLLDPTASDQRECLPDKLEWGAQPMRCPNGHDNPEGQRFCGECGAPILDARSVGEPTPAAAAPATQPVSPPEFEGTVAPSGPSRRTPWIVGGIIAAIILVGIVLALILLRGREYEVVGSLEAPECGGGYDIEFASVKVRNEAGDLIGSATTGPDVGEFVCRVRFTVTVPEAEFYEFTIGTHGGPSYSFEELQGRDFRVELSLFG
jgi:hypothetical protein